MSKQLNAIDAQTTILSLQQENLRLKAEIAWKDQQIQVLLMQRKNAQRLAEGLTIVGAPAYPMQMGEGR